MRLLSYYADDFTGATDVMEALASHGVSTVLFTRLPTTSEFAPYTEYQAVGLAGISRSQSPEWMDAHLPEAFAWLKSLGARSSHYKVCSTFDSAPHIGSIGRAAEIGARVFRQDMVPLIVGAPQLKRYTLAGHLFAGYQGEVHRIDRHPVMARHPITPMDEADLRLHLAKQTDLPTQLANTNWPVAGLALVDVHDAATQLSAGQRLLDWAGGFIVGSSGVEYALVAALAARGEISGKAAFTPVPKVERMLVVSGSVSPTTERQISHALHHGFANVAADPMTLAHGDADEVSSTLQAADQILQKGLSPLIHTARGPGTDLGEVLGPDRSGIGRALGRIAKTLRDAHGLSRIIIAGGDTSSHALQELDVLTLTTRFPLAATPGSPLCVAQSVQGAKFEIALKGGQVGADDYFVKLRDGLG
jgi:3-oxoisoapionate kinase